MYICIIMEDKIKKLIKHQITNEISEDAMCEQIGITRQTLNNLKKGEKNPHGNTIEKIDSYIEENEL